MVVCSAQWQWAVPKFPEQWQQHIIHFAPGIFYNLEMKRKRENIFLSGQRVNGSTYGSGYMKTRYFLIGLSAFYIGCADRGVPLSVIAF